MNFRTYDVETFGTLREYALQPWRARTGDAWLTCHGSAWFEGKEIKDDVRLYPSVDGMRAFLEGCAERKDTIVCWNAAFDAAWPIAYGLRDLVYANDWLDAMLLYKHCTNTIDCTNLAPETYRLKDAVRQFYPSEAGYEDDIDFNPEDLRSLIRLAIYNRKDNVFTLRLATRFWAQMSAEVRRCALIEAKCIPLVAESLVEGITADRAAANDLDTKLEEAAKIAFVSLKLQSGEVTPATLNSPMQLAKLIYDKWGLTCPKRTEPTKKNPQGNPSTDKEALSWLADVDPRAKLIHEYREAVGNRKKFATNLKASLDYNGDGKVRPQARIFSTYTGRMTYSSKQGKGKDERQVGVAIHQWKRGAEFRKELRVEDDEVLLEFDFDGQEFRWMAVESGDPMMLQLCQPGEDAHAFMGAAIAELDYRQFQQMLADDEKANKPKRTLGKVGNLSLQYRTSPRTLLTVARKNYQVILTPDQSETICKTYHKHYKLVRPYWKRQIYVARKNGYVETVDGRRVWLGFGEDWTADDTWQRESTAINFPIQGAGAGQKYLALCVLRNTLSAYDARYLWELHDGIYLKVPKAKAEKAAHDLGYLLSNLPYARAWGFKSPIQFPVTPKMGPSWGELKEVKL